ncbi:dehydrogenase/reductase SDR family member 7-like [Teleopsis dalmanni]|uniref:dehydrogenase/reductase SDR family member 7-like n=1 Tax=Teleopsis dalmanni TaxID=139649 RepID=UPI0018CE2CC4|nr:dehydrogenase/reductase SDR family member 7-like [Teleopsis dalmanni]
MSWLAFLGLSVILYYIVYVFLWIVCDGNVWLIYKEHFGKPIAELRKNIVWITGASSGIGRALALQLAQEGALLILSARREKELEEVKAECIRKSNGKLHEKDVFVMPMDMLKIEDHQKCLDRVLEKFGRLDILVNNAGRSQRANWEDIELKVDRELFELDVFSVVHLSRVVVRYFLKRDLNARGHIAVTSSVAGFAIAPFSASYCAAKHAVNAYMNALRVEHRNIDVTIFSPGAIATDFLQEAFTAVANKKASMSTKNQKRMTAERCGKLFAVALANKMMFVWCGLFPLNLMAYVARSPLLMYIGSWFLNEKTLNKMREGK